MKSFAVLFALLLATDPLCAMTGRPPHQFPRTHHIPGRDRPADHRTATPPHRLGRPAATRGRHAHPPSGTRGRMGQGADPRRPEGPGNTTFSF